MTTKACPEHGDKSIDPATGRCHSCTFANNSSRVGKARMRKADKPLRHDYDAGYTITTKPDGSFTKEAAMKFLSRVASDEVLAAEVNAMMNRPKGVSKERFGVAIRSASREPMLTANHDTVASGLDWKQADETVRKRSLAKGGVYKRIVVKPASLRNAKYGRNSAFWGEREWVVFTLKYTKGLVVRTDIGDDSRTFQSYGELRAAIVGSGWEIIR